MIEPTSHSRPYLLTHTVLQSAERFPDQPAFRSGGEAITYAGLARRMHQLAWMLAELGVRRGDRVGIYLNRCLETAIAIYGIMQAGAVYVPLDPNAPSERIRKLIENGEIKCLISQKTQARSLRKILESGVSLTAIIGLEKDWSVRTIGWETVWSMPAEKTPPGRSMTHDLAYIMYTSGSTGMPKGIMHTHASGLSYARLSADTYDLQHTDRLGNHAPIYFDICTLGYFTGPLVGATTVIIPDAHTKMPASLGQLIESEQLSVWYSVPLALIQLLQRGLVQDRDCRALRWVLFGGEVFPPKYLRTLMELWPQARFSNVYGPAEVNQCTYHHLDEPPQDDAAIPLGQVWDNTKMLILDKNDTSVTEGKTGELLIRSATMMQGYWKQPDLTEQGFYLHETRSGLREKYYRTGDLVRRDETGLLHFLGRKDQQVKTRGYRVELDAVESLLTAQIAVEEAAVFPHRNAEGEVMIMAAVILQSEEKISEQELLAALKDKLPPYAIPQSIFLLDKFPRTGSGKTDRPALSRELFTKIERLHG